MRAKVTLPDVPANGFTVCIDGQAHRFDRSVDHEKADGSTVLLWQWQVDCWDCGTPFASRVKPGEIVNNRRCGSCKRAGVPVK